MAHIIDMADWWSAEDKELMQRVGAEPMEGWLMPPSGVPAYLIHIEAPLLDLMTPPLCFHCKQLMEREDLEPRPGVKEIVHYCEHCGAEEHAQRYPPKE